VEARRAGRLSCGGAIRVAGSAGRGRSCDWPGEGDRGWRLRLFGSLVFLLPNERGMAGPNREREAWSWLLVLGASFKMPGAAGWYVRRRK